MGVNYSMLFFFFVLVGNRFMVEFKECSRTMLHEGLELVNTQVIASLLFTCLGILNIWRYIYDDFVILVIVNVVVVVVVVVIVIFNAVFIVVVIAVVFSDDTLATY